MLRIAVRGVANVTDPDRQIYTTQADAWLITVLRNRFEHGKYRRTSSRVPVRSYNYPDVFSIVQCLNFTRMQQRAGEFHLCAGRFLFTNRRFLPILLPLSAISGVL